MENDVTYPDPYNRPAPDRFSRRWLVITGCIAALMLLWQFLPAIEAWFSPHETQERTVTPRGDLADIAAILEQRGHRPSTFDDWLRIDAAEQDLGSARDRDRTKIESWHALRELIRTGREGGPLEREE